MARKTREEALATREQLLDAAVQVFRERGVGHTTLGEVADAAGVTRGAIYWHFKSKADLFEAMVARAELPMDTAMDAMEREAQADPLGAIRAGTLRALTHLAESQDMQAVFDVVFLRCEYTDELEAVEQRHLEDRNECLVRCRHALELAVKRGQLPAATDTEMAARGLFAFVSGLMRDWVQAPGGHDLKDTAPKLIDVYLAGLRTSPPLREPRKASRAPSAQPDGGKGTGSAAGNGKRKLSAPARSRSPRRTPAAPAAPTRSARS
jgi:TetR/AcrR family acrAB operon transcriptional repressor